MASFEGVVGVIFSTQRHLAKSAPSFLYWAHLSYSPSKPVNQKQETLGERNVKMELNVFLFFFFFFTLGSRLAIGSGQGDNTFVHLDAHHHASFFEVVGERLAVVSLLVHGLMEEDDATDAWVDAIISSEEELAVQPPVLLSVLSIDALEALCYAAYKGSDDYDHETDSVSFLFAFLFLLPRGDKKVQKYILNSHGLFTGGFVGGEDSLAGSDDPLSNVTELLLLFRSEEGVRVRHPDSGEENNQ